MPNLSVNIVGVLVGAAAAMVLGFLWYGPIFGKRWMDAMGKTKEDMSGAGSGVVVSIAASVVTSFGLGIVLKAVDVATLTEGLVWGALAGVAFIATSAITNAFYEDRKPILTWIFVSYQVLNMAIMGAIIGSFGY